MAAGDIKGDEAIVEVLTGGDTITKGNLCHYESGGKYLKCADGDVGPFAVAIEATTDAVEGRFVTEGPVEVVYAGSAAKRGTPLMAAGAGTGPAGAVTIADTLTAPQEVCGTAAEPMDTSGNTYTMWLGRR